MAEFLNFYDLIFKTLFGTEAVC